MLDKNRLTQMPSRSTQIIEARTTKQVFKVAKEEKKTFVVLLRDQGCSEQNIEVELIGEGAEVQILGVIVGRDADSFSLSTIQRHVAPNTISDLLVKGVFFDKSRLKYRGLIEIAKDAQNANAFQREDNLVLSSDVDIDTRPELEIEANEVRCTHAATVTPLDKEQLYYMRTRGLSEEKAAEMIIEGFLNEVVGKVKAKSLHKKLQAKVKKMLEE